MTKNRGLTKEKKKIAIYFQMYIHLCLETQMLLLKMLEPYILIWMDVSEIFMHTVLSVEQFYYKEIKTNR